MAPVMATAGSGLRHGIGIGIGISHGHGNGNGLSHEKLQSTSASENKIDNRVMDIGKLQIGIRWCQVCSASASGTA
jgi:hypothetical protein